MIGIEESLRENRHPTVDPEFLGIVDLVFESDDHLVIRDYKTVAIEVEPGDSGIIGRSIVDVCRTGEGLAAGQQSRGWSLRYSPKPKSPTMELF